MINELITRLTGKTDIEGKVMLTEADLLLLTRMAQQAEEKEAILNLIIESSDDGLISKNLDGIVTSWNSSAQRIFGYTADEMIGQPILKLIPVNLHDQEPYFLSELRQGRSIDHFETQRLRKDGSLVDVLLTISPVFATDGIIIGISKIIRDMTVHRKAEVDGKRLMAIIESSDDAIISKDLNSVITSWNDSATRIFGYTSEEMIGQSVLKIIPTDRHGEEPKILRQLKQGLRVDHFETIRRRKDGTLIHVSLTISPVKDRYGKVVGLSKIARDITGQKVAAQKKDEFISFVSHELKTPLTSLKSYIQVAQKKYENKDLLIHALNRAEIQSRKMENMINDFLSLARFEEGKMTMRPALFNLSDVAKECIADALLISGKHTITLDVTDNCMVNADYEKISMVITNLLSNARKYSPAGGPIKISASAVAGKARLTVTDQGIGMEATDMQKLFQKFHRIENEQTRLIPGFGIGLFLVSNILHMHGSSISVESTPGMGSAFTFELPLETRANIQ